VLPGCDPEFAVAAMHGVLKKGGEVRLFGFYAQPSDDDVLLWERKCRGENGCGDFSSIIRSGLSLARISSWFTSSPFDHYVIGKKGVYYRVLARK